MRGSAQRKKAREPAPRVVIHQSTHSEGSTFALSLETLRDLVERFGDRLHIAPRIFIADRADPRRLHGELKRQLLMLLTGVDDEAVLSEMGEIEFRDPVTDRPL